MVERIIDGDDKDHCDTALIKLVPMYVIIALIVASALGSLFAMMNKAA